MRLLFSILLLLCLAFPARAESPRDPQEAIFEIASAEVAAARVAERVHPWIARHPNFSGVDRRLLRSYFPNSPLPEMKLLKAPGGVELSVGSLRINLAKARQNLVTVNGREVRLVAKGGILATMQELAAASARAPRKQAINWEALLLPIAQAAEENACIGNFEFSHRSPYPLLDSPVGYLPHLLTASIVLSVGRRAVNQFRDCKAQVKEIRDILHAENLGIRELDCGSDDSGSDRVIKFWIPQRNREGKFMSRTFNLNYNYGVAEEEPLEYDARGEELEDDDKEALPKKLYVFGSSKLEEMRILAPKKEGAGCTSVGAKDKGFPEAEKHVEPYRKIFEYIGNHDSCMACRRELNLEVRSSTPPPTFPAMTALEKKRAARRAKTKAEERKEADAEDARAANEIRREEERTRRKGVPLPPARPSSLSDEEKSSTSAH